jgi:hypothetical protein
MTTDSSESPGPGRRPLRRRIGPFIWIVVLVIILFALARTMVHHRFHRGGRANPNGTIGP